jgi:hypothetical protein
MQTNQGFDICFIYVGTASTNFATELTGPTFLLPSPERLSSPPSGSIAKTSGAGNRNVLHNILIYLNRIIVTFISLFTLFGLQGQICFKLRSHEQWCLRFFTSIQFFQSFCPFFEIRIFLSLHQIF